MSDVVSRYVQLLSHEINNPLTVLCGQATLMRAKVRADVVDRPRLEHAIDQVEQNVNRVIDLVRELREALREVPCEAVELVALADLVGAAAAFVRREFAARGVGLEIAAVPKELLVAVTPVAVRGALWRLLGHALERADRAGTGVVHVACALGERELRLVVRDAGGPFDPHGGLARELADRLGPSRARLVPAPDGLEFHFPRVD